ncbi:DeoR/GlpR family DNA-binding transcription regulator [Microbacterium oxydans]|uniref:DeoR/GlpR family DNA-binding transcription regulator n=1 Tax=Microbacterium oxydans TaxID=82380 RepID=UPI00226B048D|nr:DeoR/GlpR family DNA-binding transcription regulator [Microbacterium oxydans]WAA66825.1 DeoR/GlpR family DNA-binding transcription regulator [Microbacterium oxydans]
MTGLSRHDAILEALYTSGRVSVADVASEFSVSEVTVRRDLDHLARAGVLRRVRGGAVSARLRGEGLPYSMRRLEASDAKERIAEAAAQLVVDGEAVCVDSGTTGAAVAQQLASRRLTVMPFSVQALEALTRGAVARVILPSGSVHPEEGSIVGPLVEQSLRDLRFDTVFLSCCGAALDAGVTAYDLDDAAAKRAMIGAGRRVVLVAEGAKFARSAMSVVCALTDVDVVVTDESAPAEVLDELRAAGVEVVIASGASGE